MFIYTKVLTLLYRLTDECMNLNEHCILRFLTNPDEMKELSDFFFKNIEEIEKNSQIDNN